VLKDQNENSNVNSASFSVENCRAKQMDGSRGYELVECLIDRPLLCEHTLTFGQRILCRHPRCREIVEQTQLQTARRVEN
jgi:hypothetical protein